MFNHLPELLLTCTVRGTALILIAVAAAPLARRFFGRNGAQWLWAAALAALLWPVMPATPFSLQNAWVHPSAAQAPAAVSTTPVASVRVTDPAPPQESSSLPVAATPTYSQSSASFAKPKPAVQISIMGWVLITWAAGTAFFIIQLCIRWFQTMRLVRRARVVSDRRWDYLRHRLGIKRRVRLTVTSEIRAPALAGLLQPRVLIPESWLKEMADSDLEAVWLHELGHFCRHDLLWEWLFAFARCLHWMNPLVWWAEKRARHDRELACDAWAMEHAGAPGRYGHALLAAVQRAQFGVRGEFGVLAMAESSRQIASRLRWISRYRRGGSRWARFGVLPAVALFLVFATAPLPAVQQTSAPPLPAKANPKPEGKFDAPPRLVEIRTRMVRIPETVAKGLGLPIAENAATGVNRVYRAEDFATLMGVLRATRGVEILNTPRLVSREGSQTSFDLTREFPYPERYEQAPHDPKIFIPTSIVRAWVGLHMSSETSFVPPASLQLRVQAELRRLTGFTDGSNLVPVTSPSGASWFERLTSWQIPPGANGQPEFIVQNADVYFENFSPNQSALIFGYRDTGDESMINYIALEVALQ